MNIPACRHPEPALQASRQVGDDISEHIVRYDDVEWSRIANHLHAQGVHKHVLRLDLRIFAAHLPEHALPEAARMSHGIRLVAHEYAGAAGSVKLCMLLAVF